MLKKSSKRFVSIVLAIAMILMMVPFAAFADETTASDLDGHWAENVITEWMDYGIINGYEDGTIRPNNKITRAEMTAMLDRVMDYQTKADNTFSDLGDSWYTDVILKANAAGVISGYPDGTVKPDATITRQEAVAMFSRVLSLDTKNAPEATFTDNADVADWAKDAVNAMAAADYIHGSDGQFRPNDGITRAEVVTILNNIFDKLYQKAGEYTGDVDGSAVINTDQVTLKDMTISGDLIIAEGVGDGHVVLDNVTVDGKLIVRGGGENSVIIKGDSKIDNISVERIDGAVRIAVEDNASVNTVLIDNGGQDVKIEGAVGTVNVASANVNVDITGAAKDINVADTAKNATITVTSTATADNVSTSAENTTIIVAGAVSNIDIADTANNSVVTTQSSGTVDKVTTAAGNTTVEGSGTVTDVVVSESASDATVTTEGTKVENNSSSNVTTSDDSVIAPGTTDTTPGGTTETPSVPSGPSTPSVTYYTVTFMNGDQIISTQSVASGGTATAPTENLPTVNDGDQLIWYNGSEPFDFTTTITGNTTLTAVVGSKDFAGGDGTEAYPYLISTAEQLANIDKLSQQMYKKQSYNFKLTTDIDYTNATTCIMDFCGVLDGDNHSIYMGDKSSNALIGYTDGSVTIKDLNFVQTTKVLAMLTVFANTDASSEIVYENITFKSAAPEGTQHEVSTYGTSQFGMQTSGKVTFKNCVNEVSYTIPFSPGGNYAGVFIGNYIPNKIASMISFINCENKGHVNGVQVGFFFGNNNAASNNINLVSDPNYNNTDNARAAIYVENCKNTGTLSGTEKCEPFLSLGTQTSNDEANSSLTENQLSRGTMQTLQLTDPMNLISSESGSLKINPSSDEGIAEYHLTCYVQTSYKNKDSQGLGSWYFSIPVTVEASAVDSTNLDFIQKVMLDTDYNQQVTEENQKYAALAADGQEKTDENGNKYIIVTLNGEKVVVINSQQAMQNYDSKATSMTCGTTPTYTLIAANTSGQYIGSIKYTDLSSIQASNQQPSEITTENIAK